MELIREIFDAQTGAARPIVLSIAGMDPSGGAGLLADIKTFECSGVYGLAINTGNTIQTDRTFFTVDWTSQEFIEKSIVALADRFEIAAIKIGILPSIGVLFGLIPLFKNYLPQAKIVWDPVLQSSTHFPFIDANSWSQKEVALLKQLLRSVTLLTPNISEAVALANAITPDVITPASAISPADIEKAGDQIGKYCPVLIKGGHRFDKQGSDLLFLGSRVSETDEGLICGIVELKSDHLADYFEKHGSGCVLSAAITAGIARGLSLPAACGVAKKYISGFLLSNQSLLGFHV